MSDGGNKKKQASGEGKLNEMARRIFMWMGKEVLMRLFSWREQHLRVLRKRVRHYKGED